MSKLYPGQFVGKIVDYGLTENNDKISAFVTMELDVLPDGCPSSEAFSDGVQDGSYKPEDMTTEKITWWGNFAEGDGERITADTLLKLGMKGNNPVELEPGMSSGMLDVSRVYGVSLKENTYQSKTRLQVSSIYRPEDGGPGIKRIDKARASALLGGRDMQGLFGGRRAAAMPENSGPANAPAAPRVNGGGGPVNAPAQVPPVAPAAPGKKADF